MKVHNVISSVFIRPDGYIIYESYNIIRNNYDKNAITIRTVVYTMQLTVHAALQYQPSQI